MFSTALVVHFARTPTTTELKQSVLLATSASRPTANVSRTTPRISATISATTAGATASPRAQRASARARRTRG